MSNFRALHFVFKVGDRTATARFYRDVLGMKFLRHEEFDEGCKASCNGPYDSKWSKSMIGYGDEDSHFVIELTYNYGIKKYELGNDFQGITVESSKAVENARKVDWPLKKVDDDTFIAEAPGGYKFYLVNKPETGDPVKKVSLGVTDLKKSIDYWSNLCGMKVFSNADKSAVLEYGDGQCKLELNDLGEEKMNHASAFGRIAFSCPRSQLPDLEKKMKEANETIITPLVSLDTPGKATVEVVILGDPDGHEICFVGDEAFQTLSQTDPKADALIQEAIDADKSDEWFAKHKKKQTTSS
ncbi:glyoxalase domain-containing protein 4-like [Anneissia japonica]|uniref:glyoxalase domain-containing protein 4-like n=1 Tax=Anneissia japonica TaxID=1529436 RepID=UPI0014256FBB|nr:glyoxalase domain-containing protein 4-like [Anneissia japonica]